jgi:uncharacterized membrane protein
MTTFQLGLLLTFTGMMSICFCFLPSGPRIAAREKPTSNNLSISIAGGRHGISETVAGASLVPLTKTQHTITILL